MDAQHTDAQQDQQNSKRMTFESGEGATGSLRVMFCPLMKIERTGWMSPELSKCLSMMQADSRCQTFAYRPCVDWPTSQQARNDAVKAFLDTDLDWLLMVDNDVKPFNSQTGEWVNYLDMIQAASEYAGACIVGAPVPVVNGDNWFVNAYRMTPGGVQPYAFNSLGLRLERTKDALIYPYGLIEVTAIGFGAVAIHRKVLESVSRKDVVFDSLGRPEDRPEAAGVPIFRYRNADGSTECGEDLEFCLRARDPKAEQHFTYCHVPSYSGHYHTVDMGRTPLMKFHLDGPEKLGVFDYPEITPYTMALDSLEHLYGMLSQRDEDTDVLELGSGLSTLVVDSALSGLRKRGWRVSHSALEQDINYLTDLAVFIQAKWTTLYQCSDLAEGLPKRIAEDEHFPTPYNILLVDGPTGSLRHWWEFISYMRPGFVLVMDDANREPEQVVLDLMGQLGLIEELYYVGRTAFVRTAWADFNERWSRFVTLAKEHEEEIAEGVRIVLPDEPEAAVKKEGGL